jgi:hypothetical protein
MKTEFQLVFQSSVYPLIHLSSLPKYSPGDYNLETVSIYSMSMYHHGNYTLEFICPRITMEFKHKNWYWLINHSIYIRYQSKELYLRTGTGW